MNGSKQNAESQFHAKAGLLILRTEVQAEWVNIKCSEITHGFLLLNARAYSLKANVVFEYAHVLHVRQEGAKEQRQKNQVAQFLQMLGSLTPGMPRYTQIYTSLVWHIEEYFQHTGLACNTGSSTINKGKVKRSQEVDYLH